MGYRRDLPRRREIKPMRQSLPLLSCLVMLLSAGLPAGPPALAQSRPATLPVSLGPPSQEAEASSIGFVDLPTRECRPVYAPGVRQVGPPVAEAGAEAGSGAASEQGTQGLAVAGYACDARR